MSVQAGSVTSTNQPDIHNYSKNATKYYEMALLPISSRNYPFASVFGNHDVGPAFTRQDLVGVEKRYRPLSYTRKASPDYVAGVSNYYVPIYDSAHGSDKSTHKRPRQDAQDGNKWWRFWTRVDATETPKWILYMMDSNGDSHIHNSPNWVCVFPTHVASFMGITVRLLHLSNAAHQLL